MIDNSNERLLEAIKELPKLVNDNGKWILSENLEEDKIYWTMFDGTDSDAETIEKLTGLSFLGDSVEDSINKSECCITNKITDRKVYLAKTY